MLDAATASLRAHSKGDLWAERVLDATSVVSPTAPKCVRDVILHLYTVEYDKHSLAPAARQRVRLGGAKGVQD